MNIIARAWQHAELCSHEPESIEPVGDSSIIFTRMKNEMDFGYIAEYEHEIVICFRGTKCAEAWASNFDPYPLDFTDGIHDGFHSGWEPFGQAIEKYFRDSFQLKSKDFSSVKKHVLCVGHSRGGALTGIEAYHLAKDHNLPCSCISFGAPAQGVKSYRDKFDSLPVNHTRVINNADFAPSLPPAALGFRHAGKLLQLPGPSWNRFFYPLRIRDHFYSSYTKALIKYSKDKGDAEAVEMLKKVLQNVLN